MTATFNLSIDLFTQDVRDSVDVARALQEVARRLNRFTSLPWSPYALKGTIYSAEGNRVIGTWSVDPETADKLTAENDPDSRLHCSRCGQHVRAPNAAHDLCPTCASEAFP